MELKEAIKKRYSCRDFLDKSVPKDIVEDILSYAVYSATSCNRQAWQVKVVTDSGLKEKLNYGCAVNQHYLYKAPVCLCIFYDETQEVGDKIGAAAISVGMFAQTILLLLQEYALGGIFLAGIKKPDMANSILDVDSNYRLRGMILLGHPAEGQPIVVPRKKVSEITSYNYSKNENIVSLENSINPNAWQLDKLINFRNQILWYKGFDVDNRYKHVERIPSGSESCLKIFNHINKDITQNLISVDNYFDFLSYGGEYFVANEMVINNNVKNFYLFDIGADVIRYLKTRMSSLFNDKTLKSINFISPTIIDDNDFNIPVDAESMDLVTCYFRLELFQDPGKIIDKFYKILKKNGIVYIACQNKYFFDWYKIKKGYNHDYSLGRNWNIGPEKKYSYGEYCEMFKHNFEIIECTKINSSGVILNKVMKKFLGIKLKFFEEKMFLPEYFLFKLKKCQ
ncbi:MAG: hypothetical protein A2538_04755 [Candidatus Magasanikbacteria bacterium RIFOXYD2_FULL_41_14]|uniref:Nitroreductase domain-containing protein n=1 Tax=Candidatus Magasanikbacteria bacterium RIFOXYD2_FULL_41_14 TaxID=1798709 RepID=A0A1F6PFY3_9BACT|nr:MAG: hypothetical protein A2538_04755 [Candidatus Magasanikbacteria bacterium RIFOXYD2_FULL_41_14]